MTDALVLLERRDDGVAVLRLNRPPLNPLSRALLAQLTAHASEVAGDPAVKAVVLIGSDRALAAGADIDEFGGPDEARVVAAGFRAAGDALGAIPRPVIAAIAGYALGGGLEIALACDLRIVADNARLGQPEIQLGIIPGGGGTQRLARLVGPARAKELIWSGRHVRAEEAVAIGLADRAVPAADLEAAALEWAASFASGAVVAMGQAKRAIDEGLDLTLGAGLDLEADCFADTFVTEDAATGIASFKEHGPGKATFSGR
ncbi:MAG: enoyl-CoA hydratase-related protein [Acidimicrobiia bacterium]|jgi:enoyl-CoA hydratase/carnithine racemase